MNPNKQPTEEMIAEVCRMKKYRPYMRVFLAVNEDEYRIIVGPTRAKANALVRKGWNVFEAA